MRFCRLPTFLLRIGYGGSLHEAQALWKAAWNPKLITLADSDHVSFDGYSRPRN